MNDIEAENVIPKEGSPETNEKIPPNDVVTSDEERPSIQKPKPDGRKAPRTQAQKDALLRAQAALKKKREEKTTTQSVPQQSEPQQSEPPVKRSSGTAKSKKKKQTRIILENDSSDSEDESELVIRRRIKRSVRPHLRRSKKRVETTDSESESEGETPSQPPPRESKLPPSNPIETNEPEKRYTAQQILRAFNL